LQILLLDVPYLKLFMQRRGQRTTKLLIATVSPLFHLILNIRLNTLLGNSPEPQCLAANKQHSPWPR